MHFYDFTQRCSFATFEMCRYHHHCATYCPTTQIIAEISCSACYDRYFDVTRCWPDCGLPTFYCRVVTLVSAVEAAVRVMLFPGPCWVKHLVKAGWPHAHISALEARPGLSMSFRRCVPNTRWPVHFGVFCMQWLLPVCPIA